MQLAVSVMGSQYKCNADYDRWCCYFISYVTSCYLATIYTCQGSVDQVFEQVVDNNVWTEIDRPINNELYIRMICI